MIAGAWLLAIAVPLVAGTFWPIAVASQVVHTRGVVFHTDAISALPIAGGTWVVQPWLPALALDAAWRVGGVAELSLLAGLLAALTAWLLYRLAARETVALGAACVVLLVLPLLFPPTLTPQAFALPLAALLVLLVTGRRWWLAPLVVALWANVHGSVPIALALCAFGAIGALRPWPRADADDAPARGPVLARRPVAVRAAWLAVCALASLANPLGWGVVDYIRRVTDQPLLGELTPLWRQLDLVSARGAWVVLVVAACVATALVERRRSRASRPLVQLLPVVLFAALSVTAMRYLVWLAIVAVPPLAAGFELLRARRSWPADLRSRPIAIALSVCLLAGVVALCPGTSAQRKLALAGMPPDSSLPAANARVFASAQWADYVVVRRRARVFVDARVERFRAGDLRTYLDASRHRRAALQQVARQGYDTVLLRGDGAPRPIGDLVRDAARSAHVVPGTAAAGCGPPPLRGCTR